jgi:GMP reductase
MSTTGTFAMADSLREYGVITCLHKEYSVEQIVEFFKEGASKHIISPVGNPIFKYAWVSTGITDSDLARLDDIVKTFPGCINICVDVANGYNQQFVEKVRFIRDISPKSIIMAGNVCTAEMAQEIIIGGKADIVKVGIGPGSVCTTRLMTGVGMPQLSAILECAKNVHGLNNGPKKMALVCADGGCVYPGDVAKAFGADADFVMLGGMFAGTDECEGEWEYEVNLRMEELEKHNLVSNESVIQSARKKSLLFYGMSSSKAQGGNLAKHRSSEGKVVKIPYKGTISEVLDGENGILGSLRSSCSYVGVKELKNMADATTFMRVNNQANSVYGGGIEQ